MTLPRVRERSVTLFCDEQGRIVRCENIDGSQIPFVGASINATAGDHQTATIEVSVKVLPISEANV